MNSSPGLKGEDLVQIEAKNKGSIQVSHLPLGTEVLGFLQQSEGWVRDWPYCWFLHHLSLLYLLQWAQRWAAPSGSASHPRCPPRGLSPASWHTCLGPWWASAWDCWFSAATRRVCRNSAPGGSSSSPSLLSFFSPSSGTYLLMSCWGCRYHLLPDEGPLRSPHKSSPTFTLIHTKVPLWPQVI